ncbi:MAG: DnaJ domain-containing protein [Akkermansia sp.]|nr:DnaJ domain-containing protein [Akkermansia sp.]
MRPDYYQLLDVPENASARDIKAAYRKQAMRYHPDHNEGNDAAEERFKLVSEAYRVLADAEQRAHYDGWLERHRRLSMAPELADMPRRVRVSVRHAYERRASRRRRYERDAEHPLRVRRMLMRPTFTFSRWHLLVFYLFAFAVMLPWAVRYGQRDDTETAAKREQREKAMVESLYTRACNGEASAQYRYANILYHGLNGVAPNEDEAMRWWTHAAHQGHSGAAHNLKESMRIRAEREAYASSASLENEP